MANQAMTKDQQKTARSVNLLLTMSLNVSVMFLLAGFLIATPAFSEEINLQKKDNRSKFQYHDGKPEEKRQYVLPKIDADPTNLAVEEMRARIVHLEDRLEVLERLLLGREATAR